MTNKIQILPRICVCDTHEYTELKSFEELTFQNTILNLRISHEDSHNLKNIHQIKVLNQEIWLDFNAMTASYGWTTNPLYTFNHEGKIITEISIYNFKQLFEEMKNESIHNLICLFDQNKNPIEYEINELEQIKQNFNNDLLIEKQLYVNEVKTPINNYLKTWVDKDFSYINIEAKNDFFIFFQYVIGGEFFEVEKFYAKGNHKIKLDHKPSHYFGICFNMPINSFIDYDHKHIIYGQLGISSVKVLNYQNEIYQAYLSEKFLYQQCLNVINEKKSLEIYHNNIINQKKFNYIDNFICANLIYEKELLNTFFDNLEWDKNSLSFEINNLKDYYEIEKLLNNTNINQEKVYFYINFSLDTSIEEQIEHYLIIEKEIKKNWKNIIYKTNMSFSLFNEDVKSNIDKLNDAMNQTKFLSFFKTHNFIEKAWLNNNVNTQENFYELLKQSNLPYYGFSYTRNYPIDKDTKESVSQRNILDNQKRIIKGCINCAYQKNTCQYALSFPLDKKQTSFLYFNNGLNIEACSYKNIVMKLKDKD